MSDKVVLITGASSGIGAGIARELGGAGFKLMLGARRADRLAALAEEIRAGGGEVETRQLDVTDRTSVMAFADAARQVFGRVDVIVNNAGVMPLSMMASMKVDEWDRMVDVNIKGVLYGIAAVLPEMTAARLRSCDQHCFDRRTQRGSNSRSLLRHEICGAGDFRTGCGRSGTISASPASIRVSWKANWPERSPIRRRPTR